MKRCLVLLSMLLLVMQVGGNRAGAAEPASPEVTAPAAVETESEVAAPVAPAPEPAAPAPVPAETMVEEDSSLADLIYMGVSVASKKVESIHEAPAVVSVITSQDIERLAAESLHDIMKTIPGVTITESFFGYSSLSFRGIKETHYNNRTLLLLNGQPLRDVTVGTHWLEAIPANVIDKIEIIRGPGSVLYGTGAFAGVINVITKHGVDVAEVSAMAGSKTTTNAYLTFGRKMENMSFMVGGSYNASQGYHAEVQDETGTNGQLGKSAVDADAYENDYFNVFGNVAYQDLDLDIYHFTQEKDKFGIIPIHLTTGEVTLSSTGGSLRYKKDLSGAEVSGRVHYAQSSYDGYMDAFPPAPSGVPLDMKYSGYKYGVDVDSIIGVFEQANVSAGVSYEMQKTNPYEFIVKSTGLPSNFSAFLRDYDTYDTSGYAQLEVVPIAPLKILAGVRYNNNKDYGDAIVPRGSLVYTASDNVFLKLLYGQAFRNPTFFEKYVNTQNVLYGDPDLKPEKIETLELSTDWVINGSQSLRLTLFNQVTDDLIGRVETYGAGDVPAVSLLENRGAPTTPTRNTPGYGNTNGQQINGVEFEVNGKVWKKLLGYTVNLSYKEGKEKSDWSPVQFLDQIVANLVLENEVDRFVNTLSLQFVGERKGNIDSSNAAPGFTTGQEITIPSYALLNFKSTYSILDNLKVSLIAMNLLGQEVKYPEYVRRRIDHVPGDSGSNFFGQVTYNY